MSAKGATAGEREAAEVASRLRSLDFGRHRGSHGNLSLLAAAILGHYPRTWDVEAVRALRDKLIRLLEDV